MYVKALATTEDPRAAAVADLDDPARRAWARAPVGALPLCRARACWRNILGRSLSMAAWGATRVTQRRKSEGGGRRARPKRDDAVASRGSESRRGAEDAAGRFRRHPGAVVGVRPRLLHGRWEPTAIQRRRRNGEARSGRPERGGAQRAAAQATEPGVDGISDTDRVDGN